MSWELGERAAGSWISISSTQQGGESSRRLVKAPSNNLCFLLSEMNMQLLIPQTFMLAVVARMYYRKQDDKPGYQPVSITASSSNAKV